MNKNNRIKQAFEKETPQWDKELLWENIDDHLTQQNSKKYRRVLFYIIGAFLVVGMAYVNLVGLQNFKSAPQGNESNDQIDLKYAIEEEDGLTFLKPQYDSTIMVIQGDENLNYRALESKINSASWDRSINNTANSKKSFKNITDDKSLRRFKQPMVPTDLENNPTINTVANSIMENTNENNMDMDNGTFDVSREEGLFNNILINDYSVVNPLIGIPFSSLESREENKMLPLLNTEIVFSPSTEITQWRMNISSFYSRVHRQMNYSDPLAADYVAAQNNYVQPKESWGLAWTVSRYLNDNWNISSGIRLLQINEFLMAEDVRITKGTEYDSQAYILNEVSGAAYLSGERGYTYRQGLDIKSPNSLQRINIPLSLHYNFNIGNRHFMVGTGIDVNVFQRFQGIQQGIDGQFIYKDAELYAHLFRKRLVHSWFVDLNLELFQWNNYLLFAGAHINSDFNSIIQRQHNVNHRYVRYGVQMGMAYRWSQ